MVTFVLVKFETNLFIHSEMNSISCVDDKVIEIETMTKHVTKKKVVKRKNVKMILRQDDPDGHGIPTKLKNEPSKSISRNVKLRSSKPKERSEVSFLIVTPSFSNCIFRLATYLRQIWINWSQIQT